MAATATKAKPRAATRKAAGKPTGARSGPEVAAMAEAVREAKAKTKPKAKQMSPHMKLANSIIEFLDSDKGMSPEQRRSGILNRCGSAFRARTVNV